MPHSYVYKRIFVADGNFKADHVKPKKPSRDVWLSEGAAFLPPRDHYHKFLLSAMETSTVRPSCRSFTGIIIGARATHRSILQMSLICS